jgi:hypothetical protein
MKVLFGLRVILLALYFIQSSLGTVELEHDEKSQCSKCDASNIHHNVKHILNNHHTHSQDCFFCTETFVPFKGTNNGHADHYKKAHPDLLAGLYLHYFKGERLDRMVNAWNKSFYEKMHTYTPSLLKRSCECQVCHQQVKEFNTVFHFVEERKKTKCDHCSVSFDLVGQRKYAAATDFLLAIKHSCTCGFEEFNRDFIRAFPSLRLHYDTTLTIQPNLISTEGLSDPVDDFLMIEIQETPSYFFCKYCPYMFYEHEIKKHIATEICNKVKTLQTNIYCCYCLDPLCTETYIKHLETHHSKDLLKYAIEISNPLYNPTI